MYNNWRIQLERSSGHSYILTCCKVRKHEKDKRCPWIWELGETLLTKILYAKNAKDSLETQWHCFFRITFSDSDVPQIVWNRNPLMSYVRKLWKISVQVGWYFQTSIYCISFCFGRSCYWRMIKTNHPIGLLSLVSQAVMVGQSKVIGFLLTTMSMCWRTSFARLSVFAIKFGPWLSLLLSK